MPSLHSRGPCGRQKIQVDEILGGSTIGQTFLSVFAPRAACLSPCLHPAPAVRPTAGLRTPGLRTRRHPDLVGGVRSVDGQRSDLTTPHSFHPFRWAVAATRCDQSPPPRPRNSSLSPTKSGATEARKRGGRGKAIWLLFQFRIHPGVRYPAPRICISCLICILVSAIAGWG